MIEPVVIGLGGNVGVHSEIIERFQRAREALSVLGEVRSAALYRSAPIGPAQGMFLNTAVLVRIADVQPAQLIATVLEIERLVGRDRRHEARWGPRTIDLDILVWGTRIVHTPELEVPHPRLFERRFALAPLIDLMGEDAMIPGVGMAGVLLRDVTDQLVEQIVERW